MGSEKSESEMREREKRDLSDKEDLRFRSERERERGGVYEGSAEKTEGLVLYRFAKP